MGLFDKLLKKSAKVAPPSSPGGRPDDEARAVALIEEGIALDEAGHADAALERFDAAIRTAPNLPRAHLNRGNALASLGDPHAAIAAYEQALVCDPGHAGAQFNLGNVRQGLGQHDAAVRCYGRAIELDPGFADAYVARGCVQEDAGRVAEAIDDFRHALRLRPGYAEVHSNLGNALRSAGQFEEAVASHEQAIALDPSLAQAHSNLGNALKDLGRLEAAEASYRRALAARPDDFEAFSNLLFAHNYRSALPAAQLLAEAREFGNLAARRARPFTAWSGSRESSRPLRVGFVSGDLRDHPVGYFIDSVMAGLAGRAGTHLERVVYATARCEGAIAERIRSNCTEWHDVSPLPDAALAQKIHADAIDILIDLSGHTAHNRLAMFAWKPSPVQVSWLGYFATTGVAAIDCLIADPWTLPPDQDAAFTERVWRLPRTRLCFTAPDPSPAVSELPAAAAAGAVTFGCFNNLSKINDAVVTTWARVLHAVPSSRLLLKAPQLSVLAVRDDLVSRFSSLGIAPGRLAFEGLAPRLDYLAAYHRIDIALDPFPFTGGTTSAESLWMGVPVVTRAGKAFVSRQGVGLLMNAGLADWVADDDDHYVELAARHAGDVNGLGVLRRGLRERLRRSPVMDAAAFAADFEAALRSLWEQHCKAPTSAGR